MAGKNAISHGGSQQGCRAFLAIFPDLKITVAVMANSDYAESAKFVEVILKALDGGSNVNGVGGVVTRPN